MYRQVSCRRLGKEERLEEIQNQHLPKKLNVPSQPDRQNAGIPTLLGATGAGGIGSNGEICPKSSNNCNMQEPKTNESHWEVEKRGKVTPASMSLGLVMSLGVSEDHVSRWKATENVLAN